MADYVGFDKLDYHSDIGYSSLKVAGTVILFDDYNLSLSANTITFSNQSVLDLATQQRGSAENWDDAAKSLRVDGTVVMYEEPNFGGRKMTFTSSNLPYDDIGTEWNANPSLIRNESAWDSRMWHWDTDHLNIFHGDSNNYVDWNDDGLVKSQAQDGGGDIWKAINFDQGYEQYENEIANLSDWKKEGGIWPWTENWDNKASSLMVEGSVTLYDGIGFTGENITYASDVPDLGVDGWNERASSLKLTNGSRATLYDLLNFGGYSKSFVFPTYQPPNLKISDKSSIILEGVVQDWHGHKWTLPNGWTGGKFDVFAVENRSSHDQKVLMLEMYFLRQGGNLWWQALGGNEKELYRNSGSSNIFNYLVALDAFPQFVERVVYTGDTAKWKINVKAFIERASQHWRGQLDINKLNIVKISFTLESAWAVTFNPFVQCSLNRLRLAYTPAARDQLSVSAFSSSDSVDILVTAPDGLRVGYDSITDSVVNEISGANYSGQGTEPELIAIPLPIPGSYLITCFGKGNGSYTMFIESIYNETLADIDWWQGTAVAGELYTTTVRLEPDGRLTLPHDIEIANVVSAKTIVGKGYAMNLTVTLENQGNYTETFNLIALANTTVVATIASVTLSSRNSSTIPLTLDTTGLAYGNYTLSISASGVSGETDIADNNYTCGLIKVTIPGDVTGDFFVNIKDATQIGIYWLQTAPPALPNVDINNDGIVNIVDATEIGINWQKHA